MKKLLALLLILLSFKAYSQNTTTLPTPTTPVTLSTRIYGSLPDSLRQFWFNTPDGGWNRFYSATEANLRFAPIAGGGYVPNSRLVSTGFGLLGGGNLGSNLTLRADTSGSGLQTVSNFFPKGDTRYEKLSNKATDLSVVNNNLYPTTLAVSNALDGKADTSIVNNSKRRLGTVQNVTFNSPSIASQYTQVKPNATINFTNAGLNVSGGVNNLLNYVVYNSYHTNASYWTRKIVFTPSIDGSFLGAGIESTSTTVGKILGRIILSSTNKGKVELVNYRSSELIRATSIGALSYTNGQQIELTIQRSMMNYNVSARVVGSSNFVTVSYTDPLAFGSYTVYQEGSPAIYVGGGTQNIVSDTYTVNNMVQNDLLIYGNSITTGVYAGGAQFMYANIVGNQVANGYNLIAGGGNSVTTDYLNVADEIFSLKPKYILFADGINDIKDGVPLASIQAGIQTFLQRCFANGVTPILTTVLPVATSYPSSSTVNANVVSLNTWMTTLNVKVVDLYSAMVLGGVLNPSYDAGDGIHINQIGNLQMANTIILSLSGTFPFSATIPSSPTSTASYTTTIGGDFATNYTISNPVAGASSAAGIQVNSSSASGLLRTYSASYTAITNYANRTLLTNNRSGLVLSANNTGGEINVLAGGSVNSYPGNRIMNISPTSILGYGVPVIDTTNVNSLYTAFEGKNLSTGNTAGTQIRASSVNGGILLAAIGNTALNKFEANEGVVNATNTSLSLAAPSKVKIKIGPTVTRTITANFTASGTRFGDSTIAGAQVHIKPGVATAGGAPLKFDAGTLLTTPETGAIEFANNHYYGTIGATRYQLDQQGTVTSITPGYGFTSNTPITTSGTMTIDTASSILSKANAANYVKYKATHLLDMNGYQISNAGVIQSGFGFLVNAPGSYGWSTGSGTYTQLFLANTGTSTNRTILVPDASGTIALTSDLTPKANLSGGNSFSGNQTIGGNTILYNDGHVTLAPDGVASDAMGALSITRSYTGNNRAFLGFTGQSTVAMAQGLDNLGSYIIGTGSGRNLAANIDTVIFRLDTHSGATTIKNYLGTTLWRVDANGYMKSILPAYSTGTRLPVVYNSTNDRFETSTFLDGQTPYLSKSANYTVSASDFGSNGELIIYCNTTGGSFTITLLSAASMAPSGKTYKLTVFKQDASVNSVNIDGGATNINGATTYTLTGSYASTMITSNSTQYFAR